MGKTVFHLMIGAVFLATPTAAQVRIDLAKPDGTTGNQTSAINKEIDRLFALLAEAGDEQQGRAVEDQIWQNWMAMPKPAIRKLVKQAMEARRWYDFAKARKILDQVVQQAPDYAEGWNQRAFILFLQEKYDDALSDLEKALQLEPRHFGALAGQAQILMRQGRFATGQTVLKKALKIHPYLRERSMIVKTNEKDL